MGARTKSTHPRPEPVLELLDRIDALVPPGVVHVVRSALALPVEENPLLRVWEACNPEAPTTYDSMDRIMRRGVDALVVAHQVRFAAAAQWSWAVPSPAALARIIEAAGGRGVVEVGAGLGYWAALLGAAGVDVVATDPTPPGRNHYVAETYPYVDVLRMSGVKAATIDPSRLLLMVWPSYAEGWPAETVRAYHEAGGRTVVFVGEGMGGCCADDEMHVLLGEDGWADDHKDAPRLFNRVDTLAVPQWDGMHDYLTVHERVKELGPRVGG